ncbi:GntR family transcriptional regulator [Alicyclobacillus sp. SO9]|uniref:GntR family transcriptional regulator n=1 Tax=Alicyclobacillus sp. SO9 TaxID=2665646 RepID=UPI0018E82090|nr:GntR family transcriptional regulator [Alicyclobacillus sp. SO9]QQE79796.1 GntR family transcriptional regulator [Alicyclobacillus sp. SO9]
MENQTQTQNKQEQAYDIIKSRIMSGEYGAGFRLVIDRLAKEFGFSAIPVREAVRRLEAENLVEYEKFSGVRVTRIDEGVYIETLSVLAVLEGYATRLASRKLKQTDLDELKDINRQMKAAREQFDLSNYSSLNKQFHFNIAQAAEHKFLLHQMATLQDRIDAIRSSVFMLIPHRTTDSIDEHSRLITMMENQASEEEIELFARQHKMATLDAFKRWSATR